MLKIILTSAVIFSAFQAFHIKFEKRHYYPHCGLSVRRLTQELNTNRHRNGRNVNFVGSKTKTVTRRGSDMGKGVK